MLAFNAEALQEGLVAQRDFAPVDAARDAFACHGLERLGLRELYLSFCRAFHDSGREGMLTAPFE